jgi:hypothetical protein
MNANIISAVFDSRSEAEQAVSQLRAAGISDSSISVVAQHEGRNLATDGSGAEETTDFVGKVAAGAGVGTLLGIAALAIPGVGPLVAAGAIAASAIPAAAVTGAAIGGAAGGLSKVLGDHGVGSDDAAYYENSVNNGGVFVSVDASSGSAATASIEDILYSAGGHSAGRSKLAPVM